MRVGIIGQGYVGLTISAFASKSHEVVGFDLNSKVVSELNKGISHIEGVDSRDIKDAISKGKYQATTGAADIADSDIIVIAVPTPLDAKRKPDLSYIDSACKVIGENLTGPALIINESTSYPGTLRDYIKPAIEKYSKQKFDHQYAISPERVDPGREDFNQKNTPRLFAGLTPEATRRTREFYATFCDNLVEVSSPEVAEAAKLFENTFRQVNIALVNELAQISHALGIDVRETLDAANTKPYGFMKFTPSAGVGGHCIPVDPLYLSNKAREIGAPSSFINLADQINREMPGYFVGRAEEKLGGLNNKKVLVVGVSYKPNVVDVRETPVSALINGLKEKGAQVSWHDDLVKDWNDEKSVDLKPGFDLAIIATPHTYMDSTKLGDTPILDTRGSI